MNSIQNRVGRFNAKEKWEEGRSKDYDYDFKVVYELCKSKILRNTQKMGKGYN